MIATGRTDVTRWTDVRWDRLAWGAVVAGLVIRAIWVFGVHPPLDYIYSDMAGYITRAAKMASGGPLDRSLALKPPGTHLLLAVPMAFLGTGRAGLWGCAALWWALSAATPFLAWRFARSALNPAAAAVTAWLCALYPLHISYAGYFSSETPSLALLLATLVLGRSLDRATPERGRTLAVYLGVLMGLVLVVRSPMVFNLLVVAFALLPRFRRDPEVLWRVLLGGLLVVGPVLILNTRAAGTFVGMSEYDALNFFMGHCQARHVQAGYTYGPGSPVLVQQGRGTDYVFLDHPVGDKGFYFDQALQCIRRNGIGHAAHLARGIRDLTYTTVPWPQAYDPQVKPLVSATNQLYSALLLIIVGGTLLALRRKRTDSSAPGRAMILVHLACVLPTAILFFGDPRYRTAYDVFGLMLLAALIADRVSPTAPSQEARDLAEVPA